VTTLPIGLGAIALSVLLSVVVAGGSSKPHRSTQTITLSKTVPTTITVTRVVTRSHPPAAPPHQTTAPRTSPLAPSAGQLSATQVRAAEEGAVAIARECADQSGSATGAVSNADITDAAKGLIAIQRALRIDPNRTYQDVTGTTGGPVTMKALAAELVTPTFLGEGPICSTDVGIVQSYLNGLP
jgi:hypothetical protein